MVGISYIPLAANQHENLTGAEMKKMFGSIVLAKHYYNELISSGKQDVPMLDSKPGPPYQMILNLEGKHVSTAPLRRLKKSCHLVTVHRSLVLSVAIAVNSNSNWRIYVHLFVSPIRMLFVPPTWNKRGLSSYKNQLL